MRSARWLALGLGLLAQGCATTSVLDSSFLPREALAYDPSKYPDDAAVVLYRADRYLLDTSGNARASDVLRHVAIAVLKEGGFDAAEVKLPYRNSQELLVLKARVIQPDGTVRDVDPRDMLSDTNGKGERDVQGRFFRFPDVRIGSILEYVSLLRYPFIVSAEDQNTLGSYPVRQYDFELTGGRPLVLEAIEYNSTRPIEVTELDDGRHRLRFSLTDLAPRPREPWAPHWTFTEPRWAFRVLGWRSGQITTTWYRNWEDVTEAFARRVYLEPEAYADFTERPDLSRCADARCRIDAVTNWVREKTSTLGVDTNRELPLAEAFKSGKASGRERAMAVRRLLEEAGVEARLAMLTEPFSRQAMRSFPEWEQLNRAVVFVPAQPPGLPRPLTIDLEAEYCAPGELPPQVKDQPAFVFWMEGGMAGGGGEGRGEWITLEGPPCRAPLSRELHRVRVTADGTVIDVLEEWGEGERSETLQRQQRDWSARELARSGRRRSGAISPVGDATDARWLECDRLKGVCGRAVTLTAHHVAVRDGRTWLVPLTMLSSLYEHVDAETRRQELVIFPAWGVTEEVLDLEGPPGFHVGRLPDAVSASSPGLSVRIIAEKTRQGVRLSRRISFTPGLYPVSDYERMRQALETFRALRQTVLVFEPD
jgi:hypothetical protein